MLLVLLASVYLNGVNVDGLRSQTFEKCKTVRIDEKGNVLLDCPGYQVEMPQPQAPAPVLPASVLPASMQSALTRHYWLVSEDQNSAATRYDVDVFVNAKWVRKIKGGEPQIVMEITKYLQPGPNKVLFAATKRAEAGRKSAGQGALKVVVGEGESGGNTVMIDNPLIDYKRTSTETEDVNEEFTLQGR